ncbi:hypothetical protein B005_2919 [Nocardiopsis alba ATCC BAA-2165]|uniref:Uncharacterized protein n=1 Tax=Nocardiopsis alba (strain ATCC BAA-2165 / BE74) TaxID=1205910 RepID=J7KX62_NOCAA|nr:hypothetical protein B005_2919 [Nocardiopsis alba ATCC BAA-2165]
MPFLMFAPLERAHGRGACRPREAGEGVVRWRTKPTARRPAGERRARSGR